ncbi:MAG: exopolysaccharide biosynthesis protein [Parasphingopyxis sp.]|nr:exopolysaccharide biosynthesis protein [Sphingomonadales bacterium]
MAGSGHQIDGEHALEDIVDDAIESAHGHKEIHLADLLDEFGTRSFGPILVIVSLIIISPVGSIPGLPIALGAVIVLLGVQIAFGRSHPWIPQRMRRIGFSREKAESARDKWHGWLERIDHLIRPRMEWATGNWAEWIAALCLIFLSATMIPLELIPFAVTLPGVAMLFFGVGFTARDGLMMLLGFLVTIPSIVLTILWWPFGGGG